MFQKTSFLVTIFIAFPVTAIKDSGIWHLLVLVIIGWSPVVPERSSSTRQWGLKPHQQGTNLSTKALQTPPEFSWSSVHSSFAQIACVCLNVFYQVRSGIYTVGERGPGYDLIFTAYVWEHSRTGQSITDLGAPKLYSWSINHPHIVWNSHPHPKY